MDLNVRIQEYAAAHGLSADEVASAIRDIGNKIVYYGEEGNIFGDFGNDGADFAEFADYFQKIDGKMGREISADEIALLYNVLNADGSGNLTPEELAVISDSKTSDGRISALGVWRNIINDLYETNTSSGAQEVSSSNASSSATEVTSSGNSPAASSSTTNSSATEQNASPYEFSTSNINDITEKGLTVDGNNILDSQGRKVGTVLHENKDINGDGKVDDVKTYSLFSTAMIPPGQDWTNSGDGTYADEAGKQMIAVASTDPRVDTENNSSVRRVGTCLLNENDEIIGRVVDDPATGVTFFYLYTDSGVVTQDEVAEVNSAASESTQSTEYVSERTLSDQVVAEYARSIREAINRGQTDLIDHYLNELCNTNADKLAVLSSLGRGHDSFLNRICDEYGQDSEVFRNYSQQVAEICIAEGKAGKTEAFDFLAGNLLYMESYTWGKSQYNQVIVDAIFEAAKETPSLLTGLDRAIQRGSVRHFGNWNTYNYDHLRDFLIAYRSNGRVRDNNSSEKLDGYIAQYDNAV